MKSILSIILLVTLIGCNSESDNAQNRFKNKQASQSVKPSKSIELKNDSLESNHLEKQKDTLSTKEEKNLLLTLKEIVEDEFQKVFEDNPNFHEKLITPVVSNKDSIQKTIYLNSLNSHFEIDSIQYFGTVSNHYANVWRLPLNSAIVLYVNDQKTARKQLDSLEVNWRKNFRETEGMFKSGGIAFEVENQLFIYAVNTCGPGYRNLKRIDSIISRKVFNDSSFVRLHAGCGMSPFRRLKK